MLEDRQAQGTAEKAEKSTGRVEAFSDGVFSIAITLLVLNLLNLKMPVPESATFDALKNDLLNGWPTYAVFLLSFATILIMWVYHHRMFQFLKEAKTTLLFSNGFLLLLVTAVPFPTGLVGTYLRTPAAPVACAVYAGFFALIDLAYNLLWLAIASQQPAYRERGFHIPKEMIFSLLGFPCYLIAMLVAFWSPLAAISICGVLWVVWLITAPAQRMV